MTLAHALARIIEEYPLARGDPYPGHPLAAVVREGAPAEVRAALGPGDADFVVRGSPGRSAWAAVPWVGVFDPAVTTRATRGYYAAYLFHAAAPEVHLSLLQGTTAVMNAYGPAAEAVLRDRAERIRRRLPEFEAALPVRSIALGAESPLPRAYEAAHALGLTYRLGTLPGEAALHDDLRLVVAAYRTLTARGGLEDAEEGSPLPGAAPG